MIARCLFALLGLMAMSTALLTPATAQDKEKKKKGTQLVLKDGKAEVDSSLSADDPTDALRKEHHFKAFTIALKKGDTYQIDMRSKTLDTFLRLEDANGKPLAKNDDAGGNLNSRIIFTCTADGIHRIVCTTYKKADLGKFNLKVQKK